MARIPVKRERLVIELTLNSIANLTADFVMNYLIELSRTLKMTIVMGPICGEWAKDYDSTKYAGFEAFLVWAESGTQLYWWEDHKFLTIDLYTCKTFSTDEAIKLTRSYFDVDEIAYLSIPHVLGENLNNNPKVRVVPTKIDRGLRAIEPIMKDERIAVFDGDIYTAETEMALPEIARSTAAPFHRYHYRNGKPDSFSLYANHSCEPNCGIKNLFEIVAMRDIKLGEELTIDYGMLCNSDWENPEGKCLCGSPKCRGKIMSYRDLPQSVKDSYKGYISEWLL